MWRQAAWATGAGTIGLLIGATQHEHQVIRTLLSTLKERHASVDVNDGDAVAEAAVRLANDSGGLCVLCTSSEDEGGVSSRMIQPLPVALEHDGRIALTFHTTKKSRKFRELEGGKRCAVSFMNPKALSCVTFVGTAQRMNEAEERTLSSEWSLFPPLSVLYSGALSDFSGWRLHPDRVEVVSVPLALGGGKRADWRAPEIHYHQDGSWHVACKGGMQ